MPLTIDITGSPVNLAGELTDMESVTYSVMCSMVMVTGVPHVNEQTLDQFMARVDLYERLHGNLILYFEDGNDQPVSAKLDRAVVERLLPFKSNASSVTKAAFVKNMTREFKNL